MSVRGAVRHDPAPVRPAADGAAVLRPLGLGAVRLDDGFWTRRQVANRAAIAAGRERLGTAGNLDNLAYAAAGNPRPDAYRGPYFMDSDAYKWLEAVAWEYAREPAAELRREFAEVA